MRLYHRILATLLVLVLGPGATTAQASGDGVAISCADFRRKQDGSWVVVRPTKIHGPRGPFAVQPGEIFRIQLGGTTNYGVKVAETLDEKCRR